VARIEPLSADELPQYSPIFDLIEQSMGFVPSSLPTMARIPFLFDTARPSHPTPATPRCS
jgi:hypothetical protein